MHHPSRSSAEEMAHGLMLVPNAGTALVHVLAAGDRQSHSLREALPVMLCTKTCCHTVPHGHTDAPLRRCTCASAVPTISSIIIHLKGKEEWKTYAGGSAYNVPGNSKFYLQIPEGGADYCCSYLS